MIMNETEILSDYRLDIVETGNSTTATKTTLPNSYSNGYLQEYQSETSESEKEPIEVFENGNHFVMTPVQ